MQGKVNKFYLGEGKKYIAFCVCVCVLSEIQLFVTPRTVAHQASLSMEFSRPEYWSGLPFPTPGDLLNPGIETVSLACPALAGGFFTIATPGKPMELSKRGYS